MSTTALSMITRSMRLAGVLSKGEQPDADEAQDGLDALNTMLESWSTERLFAYYIPEETLTLTSASVYTVGPGGDLNTDRPTRIEDANFIRYGSGASAYDLPVTTLNFEAYAAIVAKGITSNMAFYMFVDMQYPLLKLKFYPVPTGSGGVLHLFSWKQMQSFASLTDTISLPPGYKRAIEFSLAEEYAATEYGQAATLSPQVIDIAKKARANIKRINSPAPIARSEAGLMTRQWAQQGSIYWGGSP